MGAEDHVVVEHVDVVVAGPGALDAQRLEAVDTRGQHRPDDLVEQRVLHLEVLAGRVLVFRRCHAAQPAVTFGAEVHPAGVDDQRAAGRARRAAHMEHAALARLHRQVDGDAACQRRRAAAGAVDQRAAADACAVFEPHALDLRAAAQQLRHARLAVLRAERDCLAAQGHHQPVGVEPAFAAEPQRSAGQVVDAQPAEAPAQCLGLEQLHLGPQLALRAVVGAQRVEPGGAGQEQVTALVPGQVGRIAVHRQQRRRLADELAAEHRHADVLGCRELVSHRGRRQRGGAALVAEILFQHQQPAVEGRRAGQEVRGGAAHGRAADDQDVVVLHALEPLPNIMG